MLFEALVIALVFLVLVNLAYRWKRLAVWLAGGILACCVASLFLFDPATMPDWLRPRAVLIVQALLLALLARAATHGQWSALAFGGCTLLASLAAFAVIQVEPLRTYFIDYPHFREQYAFESMAERVPAPKRSSGTKGLSSAALERLEIEETILDGRERWKMLERLYEEPGIVFIDSPGAGQIRHNLPNKFNLGIEPFPDPPLPQPGAACKPATEAGNEVGEKQRFSLLELSLGAAREFINPEGFGYVKGRDQVAGFRPHGFRYSFSSDAWKIQHLDLVSVLLHDPPLAYESDKMPRMDLAKKAKTRPLDAFEQAGLKSLEAGEDLYAREIGQEVRVLGAIRSLRQCTECHACQRGDLLGAFSICVKAPASGGRKPPD